MFWNKRHPCNLAPVCPPLPPPTNLRASIPPPFPPAGLCNDHGNQLGVGRRRQRSRIQEEDQARLVGWSVVRGGAKRSAAVAREGRGSLDERGARSEKNDARREQSQEGVGEQRDLARRSFYSSCHSSSPPPRGRPLPACFPVVIMSFCPVLPPPKAHRHKESHFLGIFSPSLFLALEVRAVRGGGVSI